MKHYQKPDGSIWAFEPDGSQDDLITKDMSPISEAVAAAKSTPPYEALRTAELAQFRNQRELFLNRLAGIGLAAQAAGKTDVLTSALAVRQGLLDLPKDAGVLGATNLQKLKAAIDACIQKLAKAAEPEIANIFKGA